MARGLGSVGSGPVEEGRSSSAKTPSRQQDHDMSDDDFDFDEEYFLRTYKPLSNLPTPPPSWKNSAAYQTPTSELGEDEVLFSEFLGPAVHLVNLLPPAASLATPSVPLVQAILSRADLPMPTVALAVCIMDSLNSRFARQWRQSCPLATSACRDHLDQQDGGRRPSTGSSSLFADQVHIDSVCPEVVVLSALVIAAKFTEDSQEPTRWYASAWGRWLWTCDQINTTERCVMENLGYRIMPLTAPDVLEHALSDMSRAAIYNPPAASLSSQIPRSCREGAYTSSSGSASKTIHRKDRPEASMGLQQLTPPEST